MEIKQDYFYAGTHEWVRFNEDGTASVGLSDHAQQAMGDVAFVNLCDEGESFEAGDVIGDVESIKAVSDIYAPVGGTVLSVNDELLDAPESINSDPYGAWLVTLGDVKRGEGLMSAAEYDEYLAGQA